MKLSRSLDTVTSANHLRSSTMSTVIFNVNYIPTCGIYEGNKIDSKNIYGLNKYRQHANYVLGETKLL